MLLACAVVLLVCAAYVVVRWSLHRVDSIGRRRPFPSWSTGLLMVAGLAALVPVLRHHNLEQRLDSAASSVAGASVLVHCQGPGGAFVDAGSELGYVRWGADGVPERSTLIKYEPCGSLRSYLAGGHRHPSASEVVAVHVLTHEAMHMAGEKSEARTECEAVQRDAATARALGADPVEALRLARTYWRTAYPRLGEDYRSGDCGPGRAWDEHLADAPWS